EYGVNLQYFVEETPLGTAGSVKNGEEFLDQPFLVISGDALTDFDLSEVIRFHREKEAAVTIVLTQVENPLEYGVIITDREGRIKQFLEKPSWGEVFSDTVNTGIYVIQPEVLKLIPEKTKFDFSKDLFPLLLEKGYPMYGCVTPGYWCDIGSLAQYRQAHYDILSGAARLEIPGKELAEGVWVGDDTEIDPDARLEPPIFIGDNVKVDKNVFISSFSVIGSNSIMDEDASLKKSIVWSNVYIGKKGTLRGATVCNRVKVKSHAAIYEGAVVGDDTVLDMYAVVKPGVKIWPNKNVEKGTVLSESLIWGTKISKNIFGTNGIMGEINVDITPEFASKLGAAYGACIRKQGQVAVGANGSGPSQMIKNAITTGLLSAGCHVLDLRYTVAPLGRYAVRTLGVNGGVQVSIFDGDIIRITFFNEKGANILKADERKIENAFFREDFCRVTGNQVSLPSIFPDIINCYLKDLTSGLDVRTISRNGFKIFIQYDNNNLGELVPKVLEELGCDAVFAQNENDGLEHQGPGMNAAHYVIKAGCDLGAIFSEDGEQLTLIDNTGRTIDDNMITALVSLVMFKANQPCTVVVPVTASSVIDEIAALYKGKVIRTKTARQFLMNKVFDNQVVSTQNTYKQYQLQFDAFSTFVTILDYLAKEKISLAQAIDSVPRFYMAGKEIECPWHAKGTVMRRLIEDQNRPADLIDGVKIFHENGWALVLPDSDEAVCRVYSEGMDMEIAEDLTTMYVNKVNNFKKQ
ncbi:MAG: mannose-1-phosphate guanyltransferase, partial [Desulfitobacteriaceae bacterium]|nr:mannose-1-phosphate guanyltransferase [Desulfitobacteriaceae bacterium]